MGIKISIGELEKVLKNKFEDVKKLVQIAVTNAAEKGVALAIHETSVKPRPDGKGAGAVDRGRFKQSWDRNILTKGAEIRNDAPYAAFVEVGSRPHWMPLKPLIEWVHRKRADLGIKESEVEGVARAIQRKIAKKGTQPLFIMKDILPELEKTLKEGFERELSSIINKK